MKTRAVAKELYTNYLTKEGLEKLNTELEYLKKVKRRELFQLNWEESAINILLRMSREIN